MQERLTTHPILSRLQSQFDLRPYQLHAMEVARREWSKNTEESRKLHIVAPPGSGKTILGLELIVQRGQPAVVLSPNAAIQRQWSEKARFFLPPSERLDVSDVIAERYDPPAPPILSLTYQSLSVASRDTELLDSLALALWEEEAGDAERMEALYRSNLDAYREEMARYRSRVRAALISDPTFDAVSLLHPTARALMDGLVARKTGTVVLDECHHLTGTWAILLAALLRRLPDAVVIGLTATPPMDRSDKEQVRYLDLVGEIDFQVPTPAVVRDGNLAPYQDLVYLTTPTPDELTFIATQHAHWETLQRELNADGRFHAWIRNRVLEPRSESGKPMAWDDFARRYRAVAVAAVRWYFEHGWELPFWLPITHEMVQPLDLDDRLRLIADFSLRALKLSSDPADTELYARIKAAGRALGYNLTEAGFRSTIAPVDRLLSLSRAKQDAALTILRHEWNSLGDGLRAVIITDFERSSATVLRQLSGVLDPDAESALGMMRVLSASNLDRDLRPVLVTGQTLLCDDKVVELFMDAAREWFAEREWDITIRQEAVEGASFHQILGSGRDWRTGSYVAMVTALLEQGVTRCLVGTRALLGEGWDSLSLNTFIDLTYATTFASVNQLRGRAIRLDPNWPDKVANNWDVVCIAPGYEKGLQDYHRFVRKHESFFGVSDDGIIEVGVGHVHALLHELSGEELGRERERVNQEMLSHAERREAARALWRVGMPYEDIEVSALDLRMPSSRPRTVTRVGRARQEEAASVVQRWSGRLVAAMAGMLAAIPVASWVPALRAYLHRSMPDLERALLGRPIEDADESDMIHAMARAVLEAMQASGQLPTTLSHRNISITARENGFVRVWLDAEHPGDVERFARAVEQMLGPVTDEFRYMIPRTELLLPEEPVARLRFIKDWALTGQGGQVVAWHPVPRDLGTRAETVRHFEAAWQRYVSPGEALFLKRSDVPLEQLRSARSRRPWIESRAKRIWH